MKLMFPKMSFVGVSLTLIALTLTLSGTGIAQSKKTTTAKKATVKKTVKTSKDAKKGSAKGKTSAKSSKDTKDKKAAASRNAKGTKKKSSVADSKAKKTSKSKAETKREAAERKRREAERRAAALAEQRRREQARRAAIARKLAFERGLKTETAANIAKDITDGEDVSVRAAAVKALGDNAGSVVVMEAQTGKVLTIVNQDWAVRSGIKPCSTIKLVTGVAALNENVIDKQDGSIRQSNLNLDDALAHSNNPYFQRAGATVGNPKVIEYAKELGLGEPTGLNTEGEYAGKLPYGNNNPRIYSHGDDFEVTGLQLAVMVSAISNGGHRVLPRVPRNEIEKTSFQPFYKDKVDLPRENVRRVIPGMMGAAEYGTARRGMNQSLGVAGKTGSCISKGSWVGLFASVAPIEQPKYAVVVITRGQNQRGRIAAAVAAQIYNHLAKDIVRTDRYLAQTEFGLAPRNGVPATTAATKLTAEDSEDAEAANGDIAGLDEDGREIIVVPSAPPVVTVPKASKKLVTKTSSSKPLFPPVVITPGKGTKQIKP
ncbi:MAG: penicillin-binding transpeptidase domain-containing protein [Pyrinomonadaceae bacterium]